MSKKQRKPRKPLTPEQKERLRANLAKGRATAKANREARKAAAANEELRVREIELEEKPKTAEEVRAEAANLADLMVKDPDHWGRSGQTDAPLSPVQADFVPGTKPSDTLYIPERVTEVGSTYSRKCALHDDYMYAWVLDTVDHSKVMSYKNNGYKLCLYAGGGLSGLADRGFTNTDLFDNDRGRVRHGDLLLMWIERRGWDALAKEEKELLESWNRAATDDLHNVGYRHGVRTYTEEDGKQIF
jgi:hypothetical protein